MRNVNIYAFADEASKQLDIQIKALLRNQLNGLEIRNVDGENISDITPNKAKEIKEKLDSAGLITWSIGSPIGKIDIVSGDFSAELERFKNTLQIAEILGAKNVRLFSFFMPEKENPDNFKNEVIERMGSFTDAAKDYDVVLCHENEKKIFGDTADRCLEIHKALPELKAVFDPANFVQCDVDTLKAWDILKDYVKYVHIKDAVSSGLVVPPGKGEGNVKQIIENYIAMGGKDFTVEPHLKKFSGLSKLENGDTSAVGYDLGLKTNDEVFDYACNTFKGLL